jgi:PHP family Zn ribbon phosphoesterase
LKIFRAELHVHTVLSPCAEVEMIPPFIVAEALERGINLIAITDHNASANVSAVQKAAQGTQLVVMPGMELQTREEVHVLCLFDHLEQLERFQKLVDAAMPVKENNVAYFGEQFVVDETGDFIRREAQLLITSTSFTLNQAWEKVTALGGLFIPAHIDRKAFGLLANLGLVPTDIALEALELSRHTNPEQALQKYPHLKGYPLIQNGDVHRLEEFMGATHLELDHPSISEIRLALQHKDGRGYTLK